MMRVGLRLCPLLLELWTTSTRGGREPRLLEDREELEEPPLEGRTMIVPCGGIIPGPIPGPIPGGIIPGTIPGMVGTPGIGMPGPGAGWIMIGAGGC
jgi:hypothetical protein